MSQHTRGFTLIEALFGMIIVALTVLTLYAMIPFSFRSVDMNASEVQAVSVAQHYLDDERLAKLHSLPAPAPTDVPIDSGQSFVGGTTGNAGTFSVTPDGCTPVQSSGNVATVYSCSVTVTWTEGSTVRTVDVQSYVTK
jgi:type II secretory pathway pseudopilin PulG